MLWLALLSGWGLLDHASRQTPISDEVWVENLVTEMDRRLSAPAPLGLADALGRYRRQAGVLEIRLHDTDGAQLAAAPPRITPSNWGWLAPAAAWLRSRLLAVGAEVRRVPLRHAGREIAELTIYQWRWAPWWSGEVLRHIAGGALALLGLLGLALGSVRDRSRRERRESPPVAEPLQDDREPLRLAYHLRPALDALGVGVMLIDETGRLGYLNRSAALLAGWKAEEATGLPASSVLRLTAEVDGSALEVPLERCLAGEDVEAGEIEARLQPREGQAQPVSVHFVPLRRRADTVRGVLVLLRQRSADASERDRLRREADLARRTLDQLSDGVAITDKYGRIVRVNQRLNRMFAYGRDELDGVAIAKLLPVPFLNEPSITLHHYVGSSNDKLPRVVGWRKDATTFPVELQVQELYDEDHAFLLLIRDSGERQRRDNLSMRLGRLLDYAAEEIFIFDAHSLYFIEANRGACDNLGYAPDQLTRMTPLHLAPGLDRGRFESDLAALRGGEQRQVVYRTEHCRADGSRYPVSLRLSFSREEEPPVFMAMAQDITEQREAEARLEYLAQHDAMTGLPNRSALLGRLEHLLNAPRSGKRLAVLFLDLDGFKRVNDQHGHAVGDELLMKIAQRLDAAVSGEHFAARLAGDEFVVAAMLEREEQVRSLAVRISESLEPVLSTSVGELSIGVSVGYDFELEGDSAASLLKRADAAMYAAKSAQSAQVHRQ